MGVKTNMVVKLLEAGLPKLQTSFGIGKLPHAHFLNRLSKTKSNRYIVLQPSSSVSYVDRHLLQIWENYVEGEEVSISQLPRAKRKKCLRCRCKLYYTDNLLHVLKENFRVLKWVPYLQDFLAIE